jgi:hypothetical protein
VPARPARRGSAGKATTGKATTGTTTTGATTTGTTASAHRSDHPGRSRPVTASAHPSRRRGADGGSSSEVPSGDGLVVGQVPLVARLTGVLLALSGAVAGVAAFPTYLVVGGQALTPATGVGGVLVALLMPVPAVVIGVLLAWGAVPKFGLAYAGVAGALALGQLLIELYRGRTSTARPGVEVIAGTRVLTSSVEVGPGWVLGVVGLGLAVLAGLAAILTWGRTVMEDGGALDPARSGLAGAAVLLGVGAVLCLSLPAADVPDRVVTDPATRMQTVVTREGPQALLERPGLALLGGLLLAGAVVLCSVVAPSLRPRLAAVGGLLALAVAVLAAGLGGLRDAVFSDELDWTLPGAGLLVAALGYAALTALAWRLRRGRT